MVVIKAGEWEKGESAGSDKSAVVLALFQKEQKKCKEGEYFAADIKEIRKATGLKWPWGGVKELVEAGKLQAKKFGRKYRYRLVK